jgi:hypothetical protein
VVPPEAVSTIFPPVQNVVGPPAEIEAVGIGLTVTAVGALAVLVHPLLIAWTVKLEEAEIVRGLLVFPSLHR